MIALPPNPDNPTARRPRLSFKVQGRAPPSLHVRTHTKSLKDAQNRTRSHLIAPVGPPFRTRGVPTCSIRDLALLQCPKSEVQGSEAQNPHFPAHSNLFRPGQSGPACQPSFIPIASPGLFRGYFKLAFSGMERMISPLLLWNKKQQQPPPRSRFRPGWSRTRRTW